MVISYDNIKNIGEMEIYLCNPQEDRIACMLASDRNFEACFNDLSTFNLRVYYGNHSIGYYNLIETMRLLEVTGIGYFQITSVQEEENDEGKYKQITADSLQTVFKRFGIDVQNRVYCLYNSTYPLDSLSNHANDDSFIPSVVAELHDQIGVNVNVQQTDITPTEKYNEWTITYISDSLKYAPGGSGICRTMDENVEYAYDFLANKVEEAFGCVVIFDYMYKTIKFYSIEDVAQRKNAYLSFDNFTTDIQVEEDASDIVTVLRCEGDGVDISLVNPTGSGFITDFSYYKDSVNYRWMSAELIAKLNQWEADIESEKQNYENLVLNYRNTLDIINTYQVELTNRTKIIQDMQTTRDNYIKAYVDSSGNDIANYSSSSTYVVGAYVVYDNMLYCCKTAITTPEPWTASHWRLITNGVTIGESVSVGEKSITPGTTFYNTEFSSTSSITAYNAAPLWNTSSNQFEFSSGTSASGTATDLYNQGYYYFFDGDSPHSYCKLKGSYNSQTSLYDASGFDRYISYKYLGMFTSLQEKEAANIKNAMSAQQIIANIDRMGMTSISQRLNVSAYFSDTPNLYAELKRYWIEGNYQDANITALEDTTMAERIDLANELIDAGKTELSKVCQPRFRLSISGVNCFANERLRVIADTLNLGDVLVVERDDSRNYYPVLLKITFNFDEPDQLQLDLGNSLRLDDWGYTLADLITNSAQTSRDVSANWQELLLFASEKNKIYDLLENPLNSALRAANKNMTNQNFSVDTSGILGRVITGSGNNTSIDEEQIRILNNMILFTRDNWETAAAAFGKITMEDPLNPGSEISVYGLVAEALIGRLLVGNQLVIANSDNKILLNGSGITIMKDAVVPTDPPVTVFSATTDGNVYVKGEINATSGTLQDLKITGKVYFGNSNSYYLDSSNTILSLPGISSTLTTTTFSGTLSAPDGNIGGWVISNNLLSKTVGNYTTGMQSSDISGAQAFYVRYNDNGVPRTIYSVDNLGILTANNAIVKGIVTAERLSVKDTLSAESGVIDLYGKTNIYGALEGTDVLLHNNLSVPIITGTGRVGGSSGTATIDLTATAGNVNQNAGTVEIGYTYDNIDSDWDKTDGKQVVLYIISRYNDRYVSDEITLFVDKNHSVASGTYQFSGIVFVGLNKNPVDTSQPTVLPSGTATSISWTSLSATWGSGGSIVLRIGTGTHLVPEHSEIQNLGLSLLRWNTVYCLSVDQSSSRDKKDNIESFDEKYDKFFDDLKPRSFFIKALKDKRKHFGFVVDEVVDAANNAGISKKECGLYCLEDYNDPEKNGSLTYSEFIALNTWEIQKLKARIKELENIVRG